MEASATIRVDPPGRSWLSGAGIWLIASRRLISCRRSPIDHLASQPRDDPRRVDLDRRRALTPRHPRPAARPISRSPRPSESEITRPVCPLGNIRSIGTTPGMIERLAVHLTVRSPLIPFGLFAVALVLFVVVTILVTPGPSAEPQNRGFFADPLPAVLLILAAVTVIASGVIALVDLLAGRLATRLGRWAFRLALVTWLTQPFMCVAYVLATALRFELKEGWGQPIVPFWFAIGLVAGVLGILASETRRRGVLAIPLMIGAFALTFAIGELTVPHRGADLRPLVMGTMEKAFSSHFPA